MCLTTISELSKKLSISTRTLRYYEEIGLIKSVKKEDYAYRTYDETAIARMQQILVLRRLRIPLKQVALILQNENTAVIIDAFRQNLAEVDDEITALSTIRSIIDTFITRLKESIHQDIRPSLLDDPALLESVDGLTAEINPTRDTKKIHKEEMKAGDLIMASDKLNRLTDRDVRIVYLPPATVAAAHYIGDEPEHHAAMMMDKFVLDSDLPNVKPDMRQFGFNHPNPGCFDDSDKHGYELWVTISDDMDVPEPLVKKRFEGGLYAAHMIPMGAFEEWEWFWPWVQNSEKYDANLLDDGGQCMNGLLEEHLNYRNNVAIFENSVYENIQLDLLFPIKQRVSEDK